MVFSDSKDGIVLCHHPAAAFASTTHRHSRSASISTSLKRPTFMCPSAQRATSWCDARFDRQPAETSFLGTHVVMHVIEDTGRLCCVFSLHPLVVLILGVVLVLGEGSNLKRLHGLHVPHGLKVSDEQPAAQTEVLRCVRAHGWPLRGLPLEERTIKHVQVQGCVGGGAGLFEGVVTLEKASLPSHAPQHRQALGGSFVQRHSSRPSNGPVFCFSRTPASESVRWFIR